jgi:hypothetical protein
LAQRIEATLTQGGRFDDSARLPLQLRDVASRMARFVTRTT